MIRGKFKLLILILFVFSFSHAITLGEYERKLDKYKQELRQSNADINSKDQGIINANKQINNINQNIISLISEKDKLIKEIENNSLEIKKLDKNAQKILEYYQMNQQGNFYYDYVFGAKDISSFVYRFSVVDQFLDYIKQTTKKLDEKITEQTRRKEEIKDIQVKLNVSKGKLAYQIRKLGQEKRVLVEGTVSINKEIATYDKLVKYYKDQGCRSGDVIGVDCARDDEAGRFRRPMVHGYITGYMNDYASYGWFHQGTDLSSYNKAEPIYAIANGKVIAKYLDRFGGYTVILSHKRGGQYYTSIYIHMRSFGPRIWVGNNITSNDLIGYMGSTGWATGPHLHLEVLPCRYGIDYVCRNWSAKDKFMRDLYFNKNIKGAQTYIDLPKGKYVSWEGR